MSTLYKRCLNSCVFMCVCRAVMKRGWQVRKPVSRQTRSWHAFSTNRGVHMQSRTRCFRSHKQGAGGVEVRWRGRGTKEQEVKSGLTRSHNQTWQKGWGSGVMGRKRAAAVSSDSTELPEGTLRFWQNFRVHLQRSWSRQSETSLKRTRLQSATSSTGHLGSVEESQLICFFFFFLMSRTSKKTHTNLEIKRTEKKKSQVKENEEMKNKSWERSRRGEASCKETVWRWSIKSPDSEDLHLISNILWSSCFYWTQPQDEDQDPTQSIRSSYLFFF